MSEDVTIKLQKPKSTEIITKIEENIQEHETTKNCNITIIGMQEETV
jgi:hypothetical protein